MRCSVSLILLMGKFAWMDGRGKNRYLSKFVERQVVGWVNGWMDKWKYEVRKGQKEDG